MIAERLSTGVLIFPSVLSWWAGCGIIVHAITQILVMARNPTVSSAEVALVVFYQGQHSVARYTVVYYVILWYIMVVGYIMLYCGIL